jgi:hypothetical protein
MDAGFTGATVRSAFGRNPYFIRIVEPGSHHALYSTASYQAHDLGSIGLSWHDLSGANVVGRTHQRDVLRCAGANFVPSTTTQVCTSRTHPAQLSPPVISPMTERLTLSGNLVIMLAGQNLTNANFAGATPDVDFTARRGTWAG